MRDRGGEREKECYLSITCIMLLYIVNLTVTGLLGSVIGGGREGGPWGEGHGLLHTDRREEPQGGVCRADSLPTGWVPVLPPPQWPQQVSPLSILFLIPLSLSASPPLSLIPVYFSLLCILFLISLSLSLYLSLSLSTHKNGKEKFHKNKIQELNNAYVIN